MSSLGSHYRLETWRRGAPVRGTIAQLVLLAALTPSALSGRSDSAWATNLALCLVAAVWSLVALLPGLRKRAPVMAVFVAGVVAISFVLVIRDPWFGFYAYAGITYSIVLLRWPWQLAGVAATAVVAATSQTAGLDRATPAHMAAYAGILAGNMLAYCGVTWFLHRIETQHQQRGQMLDELRESNRRLEAALAENAGLHRQLLTQAREAGMLDERQRMAREIHDTLAQGLTGIITQLQAAEHAADEPAEWHKHFAAATRLARESLSEARRSVDALRPEPLETASLSEALADVTGRWSALHGMEVRVTTTGSERPLLPEAEAALLRTAQEALANVAKHAQASRVGVTLSYMEHEVALDIRDDGRGFDPARFGESAAGNGAEAAASAAGEPEQATAQPGRTGLARAATATTELAPARSVAMQSRGDAVFPGTLLAAGGPRTPGGPDFPKEGGFGLVAMRQRIEGLAGTLQIESEPGTGTGISACIPAAPAAAPP
jgi:signal transduction histidine kinase